MIGTTLTYYVILRQFHLSESQVSTRWTYKFDEFYPINST